MLASLSLPAWVHLERTTPTFTAETVPAGLQRDHHLAPGRWGRLRVEVGAVTFVVEGSGESRRLTAGDTQVIEPEVAHRVEVEPGASFAVELYR